MTETTNFADDEKLSKLLQYVFKKESILTKSEFKFKVKMILDSIFKSIHSESESESESELETVSELESDLEKEEQTFVKDEDINIRNKLYEDNYINNK